MEQEKQRIKITIAERQYPLTIHPSEEEHMRIAVGRIRDMLEFYKKRFAGRDVQDALSMSLLQFAVKCVKMEEDRSLDNLLEDLKVLDRQLDEYIASTDKY